LEFNVPFQHKYGYIRDEHTGYRSDSIGRTVLQTVDQKCTLKIADSGMPARNMTLRSSSDLPATRSNISGRQYSIEAVDRGRCAAGENGLSVSGHNCTAVANLSPTRRRQMNGCRLPRTIFISRGSETIWESLGDRL